MTKLPRKVEGDSLGAKHVNQLSEAAEKFMSMQRTNNAGLAPFVQQQCEVVAIGCNGIDDAGTEDDSDSDPAQADLYTIRVYFWNPTTGNWVRDNQGEGYCLDDKLTQTGYEVGSKLIAYFDPQRNAYVPVSASDSRPTALVSGQCGCFCLSEDEADIIVSGEKTFSRVLVSLSSLYSTVDEEPNGQTVLPANEHELDYDALDGFWSKSIEDEIIGFDLEGNAVEITAAGAYIKWDPFASPDMQLTVYWPNDLIGSQDSDSNSDSSP